MSIQGIFHVALHVTDLARLRDAGAPVGELLSQPWGERSFSFNDPDGYAWSCGEIQGGG